MYAVPQRGVNSLAEASTSVGYSKVELHLVSSFDETSPNFYSIITESCPRKSIITTNDVTARKLFARQVAGNKTQVGESFNVRHGSFEFLYSSFESSDGSSPKYMRVYTTIRRGQMLAFIFSGNSQHVLDNTTQSLRTLTPLPVN